MSKALRFVIMGALLLALAPVPGHTEPSATRLILEDFDSGAVNRELTVYGNSWNELSPPAYNLNAPGRKGGGRSFTSGTERAAYLCWKEGVPNPWPTDEMYVSFWMRYPTFTPTDPNENIKLFYPHWGKARSYVHFAMTGADTVYYSASAAGRMLTMGNWIACPGQTDGKWHHYEFYVNFATGTARFWYDGVLKVDDTFGTGVWTKDIDYISAPCFEGEERRIFSRQIDDWEIWDGMPDPAWLSGAKG